MNNRAVKGGIILEILLVLVGLGFLAQAFLTGTKTYTFTHLPQLVTADATIKNVRDHGFTLDIQFLLPTNEIVSIAQHVFVPKYEAGQHVPVLYNPEQPGMAAMNKPSTMWFFTIVDAVPGALFLLMGLRLFTKRNL